MTLEEKQILDRVLDQFETYENDCPNQIFFLGDHKFNFEKQMYEIKKGAYHDCFRDLRQALSKITVEK